MQRRPWPCVDAVHPPVVYPQTFYTDLNDFICKI
jgi:hypothetical protein